MSVLQPFMLAALPLIGLPIIIHLINQRRFQTIRWGAMMFLLAANRMSRGYARLRQWLILAFRTLAVAGLVFALSRPLASGWLGLTAGGRADTTLILVDRSSSMNQLAPGMNRSKLAAGIDQLASSLGLLGSGRWVVIDSLTNEPVDLEKPQDLRRMSVADPTSATSDIPAMLEAARDYIRANKTGRTEIWLCSDLRENDWHEPGGQWAALRDSFLEFPQSIRFHLLAYAERADDNLAVRVTGARRQRTATGAELLLSVLVTREGASDDTRKVPLGIEIEGARSEVTVDVVGSRFELKDHPVPLDSNQQRGWGRVSIPADSNPGDNDAYFVFDQPPVRQTILVSDDPSAARALQLAASVSPDPSVQCAVELLDEDQLAPVDWSTIAAVIWQAPLPSGNSAKALEDFVDRGGQVLFMPPRSPGSSEYAGVRWDAWEDLDGEPVVESWRGDQDLLAHTQDGTALPVGDLRVRRYCGVAGELTPLAVLRGGKPLVGRAPTTRGGVYFCMTTTAPGDSSLASNGVVLYVLLQRTLATGSSVLGNTRSFDAGDPSAAGSDARQRLAGPPDAVSTDFAFQRGVYADGPKLVAVNRPPAEDHARVLQDSQVQTLFQGLDFTRVDDRASNFAALVQEIWRAFLLAMMFALVMEAVLCFPQLTRPTGIAA